MRLDGSVPQKKRQEIVNRFQNDPQCRLFITTNAGSTGLNLQAANTVINVDLPWNPAVLEQRVGRAHRMGQKQPVQVYVLVTEETIEESLLGTLSAKHDLALAALDAESDVTQVDFKSGVEELRRRLEVLLGAKPEAPLDVTKREEVVQQVEQIVDHRDRVAAAGGEMLGAVFNFLGELVSQDQFAAARRAAGVGSEQPLGRVRRGGFFRPAAIDDYFARSQRLELARPDSGPAHSGRRRQQEGLTCIFGNTGNFGKAGATLPPDGDLACLAFPSQKLCQRLFGRKLLASCRHVRSFLSRFVAETGHLHSNGGTDIVRWTV